MLLHIVMIIDDSSLQKKLRNLLSKQDLVFENVENHRNFFSRIKGKVCDLVVISRSLISGNALEKIRKLKEPIGSPFIVVLSKEENEEERAQFIAAGCEAVLNSGLSVTQLGQVLKSILKKRQKLSPKVVSFPKKVDQADISDFAHNSTVMSKFIKMLPKVAKSHSSVLILGETGVGKERLAHVIHGESPRKDGPFIAIHCGALPESLLESELFGHEQGAFTGATKARKGCFEQAHNGTIFLDEIGEMPLHLQSKLLRVLESHEVRRIGSEKSIPVDVRVIAATNKDLDEEAKAKTFRKDLYYRLNVVSLTVPPLRERIDDIPELVESYIEYLSTTIGRSVTGISKKAVAALCGYSWPGNVRELVNIIERAMLLCEGEVISCDDLPKSITEPEAIPQNMSEHQRGALPKNMLDKPLKEAREILLENFERDYLTSLLLATNGKVGEVAKMAGINSRSLFDKMKRYGLNKKDFRSKTKNE
jgi:two-component system response regulator AtoC